MILVKMVHRPRNGAPVHQMVHRPPNGAPTSKWCTGAPRRSIWCTGAPHSRSVHHMEILGRKVHHENFFCAPVSGGDFRWVVKYAPPPSKKCHLYKCSPSLRQVPILQDNMYSIISIGVSLVTRSPALICQI